MVRSTVSLLISCILIIFTIITHSNTKHEMYSPGDNMEIKMNLQY